MSRLNTIVCLILFQQNLKFDTTFLQIPEIHLLKV